MKRYLIKITGADNRTEYNGQDYIFTLTPDEHRRGLRELYLQEVCEHGITTRQRARYQLKNWYRLCDETAEIIEVDLDQEIAALKNRDYVA